MKAEVEGRTVKLPDFLIVGAARSGTTSLYKYLREHPRVFMPVKEPRFFPFYDKQVSYGQFKAEPIISKFDDYARLFDPAGEGQLIGEASAIYLHLYEDSIKNIKRCVPGWQSLRIIVILRDPVERAWSHYSLFRQVGEETLSFEDALDSIPGRMDENWFPEFDYIGVGLYCEKVKAYLENFPHVKVYLFEDLREDAPGLVRDAFRFIGADDSFVPSVDEKHNPSRVPKSMRLQRALRKPDLASSIFPLVKLIPLEKRVAAVRKLEDLNIRKRSEMKRETRKRLRDLYREDVLKLQELIGRDLSGWLD